MRFCLFLLISVLLSFNVFASWQTYQGDLRNTGIATGAGYFPLKTTNFTAEFGMDFQPLVDDLDGDGKNEIVIFFNISLIIFNPQLNIVAQKVVGELLGQPTLFNSDGDNLIEIIFNSRQNLTDYFFTYQYNNSNLHEDFSLSLTNEANFSGIKCVESENICVFKDKQNYVNIVDMSLKSNLIYNTSSNNESRHTIPAIGDIDNDGSLEAVFWFNKDNDNGYGFLVFDLNSRSIEWIVDNIFSPLILGPSLFHQRFTLKGQPVLVDLNNDNKLEIAASVFYDDACNADFCTDWFTELFVFAHNGSKLFSKCEAGILGCNEGVSISSIFEGSNPFVMDYDKDGMDDICFIKDEKRNLFFYFTALNCYDYNGQELARVNLSLSEHALKWATVADMNNDGEQDIVTIQFIYEPNGKLIFDILELLTLPPIPVDIDNNNGLDLIWTKGNTTKLFLDSRKYDLDLSVDSFDISFFKFNESHINVSAIIKNVGEAELSNISVVIYNDETLENKTATLNIKRNSNATFSAVLGLKEYQKVLVNVDYDNQINETDETNNFAFKEFIGLPYVFVSVDIEPFNVASEFQDYIKNKLTSGYYTLDEDEANVKVYIGKFNPRNQENNIQTLRKFELGYDFGNIIYYDKIASNPYGSLVAGIKKENPFVHDTVDVMIVGNEIEGDIAATKEFIKNQALFLNTKDKEAVFVDDENVDAIKIYDFLHLGGNQEHYLIQNNEFKQIVKNALNDEMFNVFDKNVVSSNGITLRLRNLKPNASSDYLEYLNSTRIPIEMPVVLAHGLFSNLTTWEVLGAELSNIGRDTWLIEITGGPSQDCDDCIDYTFYNLTDIFVPALLNGVLDFTGKDNLQYVGFSNGCRAALDSLERNMFDSNKVETFVAVGCPGAFNHSKDTDSASPISKVLNKDGGSAITSFRNKNLKHVSFSDLAKEIVGIERFFDDKIKISVNLFQQYYNWSVDTSDKEPGENVVINHFFTIQGNLLSNSDGVVSTYDINKTYHNINANKKKYINIPASHLGLDDSTRTKVFVRKILNNESFTTLENLIFVLKSEP